MTNPKPENVIVNLAELYRNPDFQTTHEREKQNISGYYKGIGKYHNLQSEIVLEIDKLPLDSVYALGGFSSSKTEIARKFFGHEPNSQEMEYFDDILKRVNMHLGPNWITGQAKDRVIIKMLETVECLKPYHKC